MKLIAVLFVALCFPSEAQVTSIGTILDDDSSTAFSCDDTHTAASTSQANVQTAISAAISHGSANECVDVPAGSSSWASGVTGTSTGINLWVRGAGDLDTVGGGDVTVITDNIASTSTRIVALSSNSGKVRISGLTFVTGTGSVKESGMVSFGGSTSEARFDHNTVDSSPGNGSHKFLYIGGTVDGVADHNIFEAGGNLSWIHVVNGDNGAAGDNGDSRWSDNTNFGSAEFFFIEDNQFSGDLDSDPVNNRPNHAVNDCHTGGKHVTRYNTVVNGGVGQTHPTQHSGDDRGCRAHEIYGNVASFTGNPASQQASFAFEYNNSGTAINWGNDLGNQAYSIFWYFNNCRGSAAHGAGCGYPGQTGWGWCDSDSTWDGNEDATGYPCIDQPGRGKGDLINGDFPSNKTNQAIGGQSWPRQLLEPVYIWGNTGTRFTGSGGGVISNNDTSRIVEDRDFFIDDQGTFTGASGIGSGARASRPATCTTGVAYWSTDQGGNWHTTNGTANDGTLDKCTATNTWTNGFYTPYTYPHPLTN